MKAGQKKKKFRIAENITVFKYYEHEAHTEEEATAMFEDDDDPSEKKVDYWESYGNVDNVMEIKDED